MRRGGPLVAGVPGLHGGAVVAGGAVRVARLAAGARGGASGARRVSAGGRRRLRGRRARCTERRTARRGRFATPHDRHRACSSPPTPPPHERRCATPARRHRRRRSAAPRRCPGRGRRSTTHRARDRRREPRPAPRPRSSARTGPRGAPAHPRREHRLGDPFCVAHLHPAPLISAAAAELAVGVTNQSMDAFDASPAATFVEDVLVSRLAHLHGLPHGSGVMTMGGTASNLLGPAARPRPGRRGRPQPRSAAERLAHRGERGLARQHQAVSGAARARDGGGDPGRHR